MAGVADNVVSFKIAGTQAMAAHLQRLATELPKEFGAALRVEAEEIVSLAKRDYVPKDLGVLAASGFATGPHFEGSSITAIAGFGGAAADYAAAVHFHESEHSPPTWRGKTIRFKGPKLAGTRYLERAMNERMINMSSRLARAVRL